MTESSKDEALGRAYRRHGEIENELRLLTLEAQRIGKMFSEIGAVLVRAPQNFVFEKESFSSPFNADYTLSQSDQKDISIERLRSLAGDFRKLLTEKGNLESTLKQ
jgi:hypothetical protein